MKNTAKRGAAPGVSREKSASACRATVKTRLSLPTEEQEQAEVCRYLDFVGADYCAVPNGGHRHKAVAAKLKKSGVKAGVPDLLIFNRIADDPECRGVAIEMKRLKGGQLSPHQKKWIERLSSLGWKCFVCRGAGEAVDVIRDINLSL
jgi:hypothetical protein